jgi:hypothetical protein
MSLADIGLLVATAILAGLMLNPGMLNWRRWRATVTPLASIIGSGFLVAGPLLLETAGRWAWAAMLLLCAIGYFYGSAIRHNIQHVEPHLQDGGPRAMGIIEDASQLVLSLAYFVSVAYYLDLFAAFALRGVGIVDPFWVRVLASVVIAAIGALGVLRGLRALERVETLAVGLKLSIIGAVCLVLGVLAVQGMASGGFEWPVIEHGTGWAEVQVLLGLTILVQGFETSRYLGHEYSAAMRVSTMRLAQMIATAVYLVFILLATRYYVADLPSVGAETAIIDMLRPVAFMVTPLIIITALASQLSAAVADTNGAGGMLAETSRKRISPKVGYGATAVAAILITWSADIFHIITYASKAFVLYYGLQSLQAALWQVDNPPRKRLVLRVFYGAGVVLAIAVLVFATPASI